MDSVNSTLDHLTYLEKSICDAFLQYLHVIAVSLDLEKAYEMIWRARIIEILDNLNIKGKLLIFIKKFLKQRLIRVKVNNTLSKIIELINGVPQGSVLSVTLFLIGINNIMDEIKLPSKGCLSADDITIFCVGKNINTTEKIIQNTPNKLFK